MTPDEFCAALDTAPLGDIEALTVWLMERPDVVEVWLELDDDPDHPVSVVVRDIAEAQRLAAETSGTMWVEITDEDGTAIYTVDYPQRTPVR